MKWIFSGLIVLVFVYLNNATWLRSEPSGQLRLLSHRGVHQNYPKDDLTRDACTAVRIYPPEHSYLENTTASIKKAFEFGASVVEIDIHPTTDGKFAVFHDWTLDCRTNASGVTREQSFAFLRTLDIGYGYSYDQGKTFPFRGQGIGEIPSLTEVLDLFPEQQFLINIKSNDPDEADLMSQFLLDRAQENLDRLWFYGGEQAMTRIEFLLPEMKTFSNDSVKQCAIRYLALGWSGYVPKSCRDTIVAIPIDYAVFLWGWPNLFVDRLRQVNSEVMLIDLDGSHLQGIDDPKLVEQLAKKYRGLVFTDKIENVGPILKTLN